jgi:hypothetical protein
MAPVWLPGLRSIIGARQGIAWVLPTAWVDESRSVALALLRQHVPHLHGIGAGDGPKAFAITFGDCIRLAFRLQMANNTNENNSH